MPLYNFECEECTSLREVLANTDKLIGLELVCVDCGGTMRLAPIMNIHINGGRRTMGDVGTFKTASEKAGCGHSYACRCAIKLSQPNPFKRSFSGGKRIAEEI